MKKIALLLLFEACFIYLEAQDKSIDSLLQVINNSKEDSIKVKALNALGHTYIYNNPQQTMTYCLRALSLAQKLHYNNGELYATSIIAEAFAVSGNYSKATELKFKYLEEAEKTGDDMQIGKAYMELGSGFFYQGDYHETLTYTRKAMNTRYYDRMKSYLNGFMGESFFKLGQLDSALYYTQIAYDLEVAKPGLHWPVPYFTLAGIHQAQKHYDLALQYFKLGLEGQPKKKDVADGYLGISQVFFEAGKNDSALHYAKEAITVGKLYTFPSEVLDAASLATKIFIQQGLRDSAFAYQSLMLAAKDSLYSQEKIRAVQNLTFNEQLRQQEQETKRLQDAEERKRNVQYAAIALGLVTFLILFFLLSHSIIANQRVIRFLGVLSLLIFFEFINLVIHPYLEKFTGHSVATMLMIMVCIAALLIPLHHKLEHWITYKLVEKNNKIRLAAARKTIAQLETTTDTNSE